MSDSASGGAAMDPLARARTYLIYMSVGAVLLGLLAWLVPGLRGDSYRSEALVAVVPPAQEPTANGIPIAAVWAEAAQTDTLLGTVADQLGTTVRELSGSTTVTVVTGAPLIAISVEDDTADGAATAANAISDGVVAQARSTPLSGFTLTTLTRAVPPAQPEGRLTLPFAVAGVAAGALTGALLAQRRHRTKGS